MLIRIEFRLDVLRGLIAETTNAAKTSTPVTTDSHMLNLIRKKVKSSQGALAEFEAAGRADLKDREAAQIGVLEDYVKDSNVMSEEDMAQAVQDSIGRLRTERQKTDKGSVMKALIGPGGALDGQLVDKKDVARLVDGML